MGKKKYERIHFIDLKKLGELLREKRKELKLSLREVSDMTGVAAATLSRIENNTTNPDMETIERVIAFLGISFNDISLKPPTHEAAATTSQIPYFQGAHLGSPSFVENKPDRYVNLHEEYIRPSRETYIVRVFGESMIDEHIINEDEVIIETVTEQDEVINGALILVSLGNDSTVKRYYKDKSTIQLHSANETEKSKYPTIFIISKDEFSRPEVDKLKRKHGENIIVVPNNEFSIRGIVKCVIRRIRY